MRHKLSKLEWDSNFFNFNVAKIEGSIQSRQDIKNIEMLIKKSDDRLFYYSTSKELPLSAYESEVYHLVQVDRRVTYVKFIDSDDLEIHKSVKSVNKNISYKDKLKLIDLAIQSGIHSRFNIDKNIGKEKFEEMYRLWMINSLNYKIAKEVLTFIENDKLMGVITLMGERDEAYIGIIAVEHTFRGRGIGEILMKSAEKRLSNLGYNSIKVVTQENNIPACRLYEKCGYVVENVEYFYHIWKK